MASRGEPERLTANGKERAIITKVGKRSDVGWESRGWKFTQEELSNPPSLKDNMLMSEETEYRKKAHTFIFDCCQLLRAKALVIAAAMTICQRYFSQVSFRKIDRNDTAAAAIFLASKVEEFRVHIRDVMMVTHKVRHKGERRLVENSDEYVRYKERLLKAENQLVNALGFDFMIEHPFGHASDLVSYLAEEGWVPADKSALISKGSHHLLIKSLRGTMCLEHPPNFRARLVTYLSLLVNNVPPPPGGWAEMIQFEDHRRLNRAACQLLDTLDDDPGKTGRKITKKRVAASLVEAGHIKTKHGPDRVPRPPPALTYADRERMAAKANGGAVVASRSVSPHGRPYPSGRPSSSDRPAHGGERPSSSSSSSHGRPSSHGRMSASPHRRSSSGDRPPPPSTSKRPRTEDSAGNGSAVKPRPPPPPPRHSSSNGSSSSSSSNNGSTTTTSKPRPPPPRPSSTNGQSSKPRPPPPRPSSSNGQPQKPRPPPPRPSTGSSSGTGTSNTSKPKPPPPTTPRPPPPTTGKRPRSEERTSNGSGSGNGSTPRPRPPPPRPSSSTSASASTPSKPKAPRPPSKPHPDMLKKQISTPSSKPSVGSGGSAPAVRTDGGAAQGKRSREERAEEESSSVEPGSGGKRSRTTSSGDVKDAAPAGSSIEDGEVEDGELLMKAAAVPVL